MDSSTPEILRLPWLKALAEAADEDEIHLVGGAVRDQLLGLPVHDLDVVVAGDGGRIAEAFAERTGARLILLGGKDFAAYRLIGDGYEIDLWDRVGMPRRDDLARRDLTVNAIALDLRPDLPEADRWVDPFGGRRDIEQKILRATTGGVFAEDPLRVLRLGRLAAKLPDFRVDPDTLDRARAAAPKLTAVARERIRDELTRLFHLPGAGRGVEVLGKTGVYPRLWLGESERPQALAAAAVRQIEALPEVADELTAQGAPGADLPAARWVPTFAPDPEEPSDTAALDAFHQAGFLTVRLRDRLRILLADDEIPAEPLALRRFVHRQGDAWPTAAARIGARAAARDEWRERVKGLLQLVAQDGDTLIDPPTLLDGIEVQELLGVSPGPAVGEAMRLIRQAQVDGEIRTAEEAKGLLRAGRSTRR
ncbi:MAG: hypothetical protein AAF481_01685 [Acidobacteriota bacterium]